MGFPRLGRTETCLVALNPNDLANVAAYCLSEVVGRSWWRPTGVRRSSEVEKVATSEYPRRRCPRVSASYLLPSELDGAVPEMSRLTGRMGRVGLWH